MHYEVRGPALGCTFARPADVPAIQRVVPTPVIQAALADAHCASERVRKLSLEWVVLVLVSKHLHPGSSFGATMERLVSALRLTGKGPQAPPPGPSALVYRRKQLGARAMVGLLHRVARPIATRQTPGAFLGDLRLMALDGWTQAVADTAENAAYFGRHDTDRGSSAFPQAQIVWLCEAGTHAVVDAGVWPCHTSEDLGAHRLLRSVGPGMLVMWDAGLYSFALLQKATERGAHVLARLPANVKPVLQRALPDGSALVWVSPKDAKAKRKGVGRWVRLISYRIDDPHSPKPAQVYRLVSTCLDEAAYPAQALARAYHERWEVEGATDEVQVHQEGAERPLSSQTPVGIVQELYALLLAHFVTRFLMHEAAMAASQVPIDPDRISFTGTLRVLQAALPLLLWAEPAERPCIYARMLEEIARQRLPARRPRSNARVVRRKMSSFPLKRPGRSPCVRLDRHFHDSIRLI